MSSGIDGILAFFEQHSVIGMMNLQPHAEWLIYTLAVLDLALTYVLSVEDEKIKNFIHKTLRYGFFLFIIRNFQDVANMLYKTFATAGSVAATGNANAVVLTPGSIWNRGFEAVGNLFSQVLSLNPFTSGFGLWFLTLIAITFTAIATFQMVLQFLEMKIEFCIFSTVSIFFLPFSCIKQLNFLFDKIKTGFFSSLIKIMVMYFMFALVNGEISKFVIEAGQKDPSFDTVNMALRFMVMGLIVARLPQFAASIMTGGTSMNSLGDTVQGAVKTALRGGAVGAVGSAGFAAGVREQFRGRLQEGQTVGQAFRGTATAAAKDMLNAAAGDPAKVWFSGYDKGKSRTMRRANPFEEPNSNPRNNNNLSTVEKIKQKEHDDCALAATNFVGRITGKTSVY